MSAWWLTASLAAKFEVQPWTPLEVDAAHEHYQLTFVEGYSADGLPADTELLGALLDNDMGVDSVKALTKPQLYTTLGLPAHGEIPLWRPFIAVQSGVDAQDNESPYPSLDELRHWAAKNLPLKAQTTPANMLPPVRAGECLPEDTLRLQLPQTHRLIRAHPHQLQATVAMLDIIFGEKPDDNHRRGILNADEMGLGKTAGALLLGSMVRHFRNLQKEGLPFPERWGACLFSPVPTACQSHESST